MFWRTARSGTFGVGNGAISGGIAFNGIPSGFIVAVSTSVDTAFTQSNGSPVTLSVQSTSPAGGPWAFSAMYVRSASLSNFTEDLPASGNIFGGDIYTWTTQSIYYYDVTGTVLLVPITGTLYDITNRGTTGGGTTTPPPLTGQLFPRGIPINR